MHDYEPYDDFDYRDDKLCQHKHVDLRLQPKPAYVNVVRSLSVGAERLWEDLKKTPLFHSTHVSRSFISILYLSVSSCSSVTRAGSSV